MENQDSAVPHRRHTDSPSGALSPKEVLRQSETRFHLLVESVQDYAIYMLDPEGYVVSWNAGARRILGYTDAEILGQHFSVFYVPQDRAQEAPQQGLQAAAAEGRYEAEGRRMRKNGSLFWANVIITALRDEQGHLVGFGKVTRDLTAPRRAEDERTARAAAEEAVRTRDAFILAASHELRTPLTSLKGFVQMLLSLLEREGTLDPVRSLKTLRTIDRQADKLAALITHLLTVSRIQEGKLLLDRTVSDLVPLAEDTILAAQIRTDHHTITLDAPRPVLAWVDALRVDQVLTNLLDNAIKFSPQGGAIDVAVWQASPEMAQVAVRDHGLGVPPEQRAHIFERFYQAHAPTSRSGLGLGLYISHEIVTLHGGHLTVAFPSDGGTRFLLSLPASQGATLIPPSRAAETPHPETAS